MIGLEMAKVKKYHYTDHTWRSAGLQGQGGVAVRDRGSHAQYLARWVSNSDLEDISGQAKTFGMSQCIFYLDVFLIFLSPPHPAL